MTSTIRRVAVLTSGMDGPGMNAAIRAVVRQSLEFGWAVAGVRHGFVGLLRAISCRSTRDRSVTPSTRGAPFWVHRAVRPLPRPETCARRCAA